MKNALLAGLSLIIVGCSSPEVPSASPDLSKVEKTHVLYDAQNTIVGFGAFKTTAKKEVKGWFTDFKIDNLQDTSLVELAFANATFEINVNSLETNDSGRNQRLLNDFFGKTLSAEKITGKVLSFLKDSSLVQVEIDFNGIKKPTNFTYLTSGDTLKLKASINLQDYNAIPALESLNKVCESLHKGDDGVSKTWSEVNLYLETVLKK